MDIKSVTPRIHNENSFKNTFNWVEWIFKEKQSLRTIVWYRDMSMADTNYGTGIYAVGTGANFVCATGEIRHGVPH